MKGQEKKNQCTKQSFTGKTFFHRISHLRHIYSGHVFCKAQSENQKIPLKSDIKTSQANVSL